MSSSADEFVRVRCPGCEASLKLKGAVRPGKRIQCPKCQGEVVIPGRAAASAQEPRAATVATAGAKMKAAPPKKSKSADDEDDWLDDLDSLDDTAVNLGNTAQLPPRVGGSKPRKPPSSTIETRKPRATGSRNHNGDGGFSFGSYGPIINCVCGGLIGGFVGAGIWAAILYGTGFEVGWIAWAVGALAGVGVRLGSGGEDGPILGLLAVAMAFASIVMGKAVTIYFVGEKMGAFPVDANPIKVIYVCFALVPLVLTWWDGLWFVLAGASAFKIGAGIESEE